MNKSPAWSNSSLPQVSVIVATIGRESLRAAVRSIAHQVKCVTNIIVVLDRPSRADYVRQLLEGMTYELILVDSVGAAAARNIGLRKATGHYIGYLDDDDLWLPDKCARQIEAISRSPYPERTFSVVESQFVRADGELSVSRSRPFDPSIESFGNFIVARHSVYFGSVHFNTPALLGPSRLMRSIEWDESLRKHQDWDLLVRLWEVSGVQCVVVDAPLVVVHQGSSGSISKLHDWRDGEVWLIKHDKHVTGRPRADFISLHMLRHAVRARSFEGVIRSFRLMWPNVPHAGASIRCVAGVILGR